MCETSVHPDRETHEPAVIVSFTERWGRVAYCPGKGYCFVPYRWHHTWQVIEGEPIDEPGAMPRVLATRSSGTAAPQDHK